MSEKKDPFDGEYIGNIWGWKFSLFGLALILLLFGVIVYRHYVLDIPIKLKRPEPVETLLPDTLKTKESR